MNGHLNSEQFDGMLHGEVPAEAAQHLRGCERCTAELGALRGMFGDFRMAATASAERQRFLMPAASARRVPRMAWAVAMAALCVGIATPVAMRRHVDAGVAQGGVVRVAPVEISDEALLSGVRDDLSASVPEPMLALSSSASTSSSSTSSTSNTSNTN